MNKTHYERRSHEQGNYEITPTYPGLIVVTIKSLATGQTMEVYLDEPTQEVVGEINFTTYTGHFYEEEFMYTPSDGFKITGLPVMYPFIVASIDSQDSNDDIVIDVENHSIIFQNSEMTDSINLASSPFGVALTDSQDPNDTSRNVVEYTFTPSGGTSEEPDVPNIGDLIGCGTMPTPNPGFSDEPIT